MDEKPRTTRPIVKLTREELRRRWYGDGTETVLSRGGDVAITVSEEARGKPARSGDEAMELAKDVCDECGIVRPLVEFSADYGYEASSVCAECLRRALAMLEPVADGDDEAG